MLAPFPFHLNDELKVSDEPALRTLKKYILKFLLDPELKGKKFNLLFSLDFLRESETSYLLIFSHFLTCLHVSSCSSNLSIDLLKRQLRSVTLSILFKNLR